jgi:hypothetical protein
MVGICLFRYGNLLSGNLPEMRKKMGESVRVEKDRLSMYGVLLGCLLVCVIIEVG